MSLQTLVRTSREQSGKSVAALAKETKLSRSFLWRMEQGKVQDLKVSSMLALSRALDIPVGKFVASMQRVDNPYRML